MKRPGNLALALMLGFVVITIAAIFSQWERRHPEPFEAARKGQAGHLAYHLGRGVDPNQKNNEGESLLYLALGPDGSYEAVSLLVNKGAALEEKGRIESILGLAVRGNRLRDVQLLLKAGAPVNQRDRLGRCPLHRLRDHGVAATIAGALLRAGADLNLKDNSGLKAADYLRSLALEDVDRLLETARETAH